MNNPMIGRKSSISGKPQRLSFERHSHLETMQYGKLGEIVQESCQAILDEFSEFDGSAQDKAPEAGAVEVFAGKKKGFLGLMKAKESFTGWATVREGRIDEAEICVAERGVTPRTLKVTTDDDGYRTLLLSRDGKQADLIENPNGTLATFAEMVITENDALPVHVLESLTLKESLAQ